MSGSNSIARFVLIAAACVFLAVTLHLAIGDKATAAMVTAATGAGLLVFAFLPVFESIEAFGILVKIRGQIDRAEELLSQMRNGALVTSQMALSQLAWSGRPRGVDLNVKAELLSNLDSHLEELGIPVAQRREAFRPALSMAAYDLFSVWHECMNRRRNEYRSLAEVEMRPLEKADPHSPAAKEARRRFEQWHHRAEEIYDPTTSARMEDIRPLMTEKMSHYPFPEADVRILTAAADKLAALAQECWKSRTIPEAAWPYIQISRVRYFHELFDPVGRPTSLP